MSNSTKSLTLGRIGVASSVSFKNGAFDPLAALDYTARYGFSPVQIYLDREIIESRGARQAILERVQQRRLSMLVHAPGLLRLPEATEEMLVSAALELLARENCRRVVYHFDETRSIDEATVITES